MPSFFAKKSRCLLLLVTLVCACDPAFDTNSAIDGKPRSTSNWPSYGGPGGTKYADLAEINKSNVKALTTAWVYRTGDVSTVFQATPILHEGQLVLCSPHNKVIALDPLTGAQLWTHDPKVDTKQEVANEFNCRGVASWGRATDTHCSSRIFTATNDARLIALDAISGTICAEFGNSGTISLSEGVGTLRYPGEYQVTSPPAVVGDVIVVGSAISDGNRVEAPSGVVRGYNVHNGALLWAFDLAPPNYDYRNRPVSTAGYALGTPNVWSAMTVDAERDMIFLPTGNPAPDYDRPDTQDLSHYGSSVIALKASTGKVIWTFQTVLNDLWDFDVPSQPVLAELNLNGNKVPTVIQSTKMGFVFVLHRDTGEPVIDVEYREVPVTGPLADQLSSVQPFPPAAFQVSRAYEKGQSLLGLCDSLDAESVAGPIYTPITEQWTIGLPSNMGATNWGGIAVDSERGLIAVHTNSVPFRTKLIKRTQAEPYLTAINDSATSDAKREQAKDEFRERFQLEAHYEVAPQVGSNYLMARHAYLDPTLGVPCSGTPMAEMMVIDVAAQTQVWRRPHGTVRDMAYLPLNWGVPGVGGPLMTQSGLIFIGGAAEKAIRAYDTATGEELWHHRLPYPGNATPMTYTVTTDAGPKQFVVIAAGGDARTGIGGDGDTLVAFALP